MYGDLVGLKAYCLFAAVYVASLNAAEKPEERSGSGGKICGEPVSYA